MQFARSGTGLRDNAISASAILDDQAVGAASSSAPRLPRVARHSWLHPGSSPCRSALDLLQAVVGKVAEVSAEETRTSSVSRRASVRFPAPRLGGATEQAADKSQLQAEMIPGIRSAPAMRARSRVGFADGDLRLFEQQCPGRSRPIPRSPPGGRCR
jgi:hypothetical protein